MIHNCGLDNYKSGHQCVKTLDNLVTIYSTTINIWL